MEGRGCGIFCFKDCNDKYETMVMKKDIDTSEKLSLKKNSVQKCTHHHTSTLKKVHSNQKFEQVKCSTDRSHEDSSYDNELLFIKKKLKIQKEVDAVNQSISEISEKYQSKIKAL